MKKMFFPQLLLFFVFKSFAQADTTGYNAQAKEFVQSFFSGTSGPSIVAAKLDSFTISTITDALSQDSFMHRTSYDNWKTVTIDSFIVQENERHYLDSSVQALYSFSWTTALLPNSTILSQQNVDDMMAAGTEMPKYIKDHYKTDKFYWLSKPIFLRNNNYCVFYVETNNGKPKGSEASLLIYTRKKNKWEKLMKLKTG